ncbi:MAG: M15 family metallopeptidase [Bacteroidota bacterium]
MITSGLFKPLKFLLVCNFLLACASTADEKNPGPCPPCPECPSPPPLPVCEIIDSKLSFDVAIAGIELPDHVKEQLTLLEVAHIGYDGKKHRGQLVCHRKVAGDLAIVFNRLLRDSFPIEKVIPVSQYGWDDEKSMSDNNTSCFNYRRIPTTGYVSQHAFGYAVDINPRFNPQFIERDTVPHPANGIYDTLQPGTIKPHSSIIEYFREIGWKWGGNWPSMKDYQHFSRHGY